MARKLDVEVEVTENHETDTPTAEQNERGGPRMRYWRVRVVRRNDGSIGPDIPDGIPWVGNTDKEWYIIAVPYEYEVPGAEEVSYEAAERTYAEVHAHARTDDVAVWEVRP